MTAVLAIGAVIAVLDQLTKAMVLDRLPLGIPVPVIEGFLSLTLVMNTGLAFGLLGGLPAPWRWVASLLSIGALVVLARIAVRVLSQGGVIDQVAIGLIFGGAVGNLIDRARFGAVVDFIDVYYRVWHWWAFNAADAAISVGVAMLALRLIFRPGPDAA